MGQSCQVCIHIAVKKINEELVSGQSVPKLSRKYNLSLNSLYAHRDNHLPRQLVTGYQIKQTNHAVQMRDKIDQIIDKAEDIFERNYQKKRDGMALKALDSQRQTFELLLKISQFLLEAEQVSSSQNEEDIIRKYKEEQQQDIDEKISIFTEQEKHLLMMLNVKMVTGDKHLDVLKSISHLTNPVEYEKPVKSTHKRSKMRRTKFSTDKDTTQQEKPQETPVEQVSEDTDRPGPDWMYEEPQGKQIPNPLPWHKTPGTRPYEARKNMEEWHKKYGKSDE